MDGLKCVVASKKRKKIGEMNKKLRFLPILNAIGPMSVFWGASKENKGGKNTAL